MPLRSLARRPAKEKGEPAMPLEMLITPADVPPDVTYTEARTKARLWFPYSPEGVAAVRTLPGARFRAPETGSQGKHWVIDRPVTAAQAATVMAAIRIAAESGAALALQRAAERAALEEAKRAGREAEAAEEAARSERVACASEATDAKALRKAGLGAGWEGWRSVVRMKPYGQRTLVTADGAAGGMVFIPNGRHLGRRRDLHVGDVLRVDDDQVPGSKRAVRIVAFGRPWSEGRSHVLASIPDEWRSGNSAAGRRQTVRWAYWHEADAEESEAFRRTNAAWLSEDTSFLDAHAGALAALSEFRP